MKTPTWQRPRTTKAYLHRPLSERVAILCPDFKLLTLSLLDNGVHVGQPGVGLLFLHGEDMVGFDPEDTRYRKIEYGLPIYEVMNRGEVLTRLEAFFRKRGQFERGLTGRMTSCASVCDEAYFGGYGDVWYTMQSETYWIKAWCLG